MSELAVSSKSTTSAQLGTDTAVAAIQTRARPHEERVSLWFLFWTFLKMGCVSFGGFMSLISVIENAIVKQRKLLEHNEMLDGISLANLLPGPMAVNVVAFVGYRLRGPTGATAAATGVLLPSFVLLVGLSYFYFQYGHVVGLQNVFRGFIPAIAAIVISVVWRMSRKSITGPWEVFLLLSSATIVVLLPQHLKVYGPPAIIAGAALIGYVLFHDQVRTTEADRAGDRIGVRKFLATGIFLGLLVVVWFFPLPLQEGSLTLLILTFASMSLMLFGGGYVFIPIIGSIVVLQHGWVTQQEFTDAIALGQITPGPILISAAFIGFKVSGLLGAACATVAIYTPPAVLMVTASQALSVIRQSRAVQAGMHGVHCAVIGLILVAAFVLLRSAFPGWPIEFNTAWPAAVILTGSLIGLLRFNLDVIWVIVAAGVLGYFLY